MAKKEEPAFSNVIDPQTLAGMFSSVWKGFKADENWLNNLAERILELSEVTVLLEHEDAKNFPFQVSQKTS